MIGLVMERKASDIRAETFTAWDVVAGKSEDNGKMVGGNII